MASSGAGGVCPVLRLHAQLEARHLRRVRDELARRSWLVPWQVSLLGRQNGVAIAGADDKVLAHANVTHACPPVISTYICGLTGTTSCIWAHGGATDLDNLVHR